jgi:tripartite-type tricarboxylate transporter receptor subunit TctC
MIRITRRSGLKALAGAIATLGAPDVLLAEDWPTRQVTILLPTAAGGNTDIMARLAAEYLQNKLGQPFIVVNKPSAGGVVTTEQTATAPADGYTLMFGPNATIFLTPLVQKIDIDPEKTLIPVTNVGTGAQVVAIKRSLPVTTLSEFLEYARGNPGKLNFVVAGVNNISHLGPLLLFKRAGVQVTMVPQRGEPQAISDLMGGEVDLYFGNASVLLQHAQSDKIRLLAVGTAERLPAAPDLPTISETMPGFVFASWNGFFVAAGTPSRIVERLRHELIEMASQPQLQQRLRTLGIVPGGQDGAQVAEAFKNDRKMFAEAVAAAGIPKP